MSTPADHRILRGIMGCLFDWDEQDDGPITSWQVWERVERKDPAASYERFKRLLNQLESDGKIRIRQPGGKKVSRARCFVTITEPGADWWSDEVGYGELLDEKPKVDSDQYVGKRILAEKPLPREVWQALMRRHKAGELDIAFMPNKSL